MQLILKILGIFFILTGVYILIAPDALFSFLEDSVGESWFYYTAIFARIILGILFFKAAPLTKYPRAFKSIGILVIMAAIIFLIIGQQTFLDFFSSIISTYKPYTMVSGLVTIGLGGFMVYAISNGKKTATLE